MVHIEHAHWKPIFP
jgi:hypothetical protein